MNHDLIKSGGFVPSDDDMKDIHKAIGEASFVHNRYATLAKTERDASGSIDTITAVNGHLVTSDGLSEEEKKMTSETLLWIQHVTIGIAKQNGWSDSRIADPRERTSSAYWNFVTQAVISYTPWVLNYYNTYYMYRRHISSGQIDMASIIRTVVMIMLGAEAAQKMSALARLLATTQDVGVENVATFFWNHKSIHSERSNWTMSPIVRDANGNPELSYAFTYMSYTQTDWRSLFVQSHYESFQLDISGLGVKFFMNSWLPVKATVEHRLNQWLTGQIHHAPIG